jgi:SWI/SNF-related matrix-associated actin-dependent regulator of chromatin subfamily A-like protein 1
MSLLPHQIDAAIWLSGRRNAYLADEPGLGKTRSILASIPEWHTVGVVAPAIVTPHWKNEAIAVDRDPNTVIAFSYQSLISSKGPARRTLLADCDTLILDEAHLCSNPEAKRTNAIFSKDGLASKSTTVVCASGTPMARHPGNLYPVLASQAPHILNAVQCRTYMEWIEATCHYEFRRIPGAGPFAKPQLHVTGARDTAMLHRLLTQPVGNHPAYMLRRTVKDSGVLLPSLWWQWKRLHVDTAILDMTIKSLPDDVRARLPALPDRMQNDPGATVVRHALGVAKASALLPTLADELSVVGASPVVLVAHHSAVMDMLEQGLRQAGVSLVRVDGSTSQEHRVARMQQFQKGEATVFLGSIGAMQTGVTLTRAQRIVIIEPGWTGDANVQVVKRIHRISQEYPCRAELIVAANTLEEAVMRQVEAEIAMSESIIDGGARPIRDSHLEW